MGFEQLSNKFHNELDLKNKISNKTKENNNIHFIKNGEELKTNDLHIKAYPSTDLGISIYVKEGDSRIFHGGDLTGGTGIVLIKKKS